jgi:hypothetical protein
MAIWKNLTVLSLVGGVSLWLAGCTPSAPPSSTNGSGATTDGHGHEGHDHAHDHAHHGPHGGELMAIGEEAYHAEWTHDEEGKITFYILDSEAKKEVPIAAEKIMIDVKIGDEPKSYELLAVNPSGEPAKTAQFEIVDKDLRDVIAILKPGDGGVTATLNLEIDGTPYSQKIEKEAHDHGHDHAHGAEAKPGEPKPE